MHASPFAALDSAREPNKALETVSGSWDDLAATIACLEAYYIPPILLEKYELQTCVFLFYKLWSIGGEQNIHHVI